MTRSLPSIRDCLGSFHDHREVWQEQWPDIEPDALANAMRARVLADPFSTPKHRKPM